MSDVVLVVDDDRDACETMALDLQGRGFETVSCTESAAALTRACDAKIDAVLADVQMPEIDGLELCRRVRDMHPNIPVIVVTAFGSLETAVEAMRAGAFDFVTKPIEMELVAAALERALRQRKLEEKVQVLSAQVERFTRYGQLLGESQPMQHLYTQLQRLADINVSVLITGESGTGKELAAWALHSQSTRRQHPFIPVNCPALPEALLESELFGHAAGAYTGARTERTGLFQQADGGTLFLDEIGDIPYALQSKLLRAIEEQKVRPVGSDREVRVDVRIIAATNQDLNRAVREHQFREDLFYRINVVRLCMPPLRDRGNDILLLAQHFLETAAKRWDKGVEKFSSAVADRLLRYHWPGNVRELRNVVEHAVALTSYKVLQVGDLPPALAVATSSSSVKNAPEQATFESLADMERKHILKVLEAVEQNKTEAARILGLDRKTLYRKLAEYSRT